MEREINKFTVLVETGHIEILERKIITDSEGNRHNIGNHRRVLSPGDDVDNEHDLIKRHANRHWTPEMIAARRDRDNV